MNRRGFLQAVMGGLAAVLVGRKAKPVDGAALANTVSQPEPKLTLEDLRRMREKMVYLSQPTADPDWVWRTYTPMLCSGQSVVYMGVDGSLHEQPMNILKITNSEVGRQ